MQQRKYQDGIGYLKRVHGSPPDPNAFALLGQAYSISARLHRAAKDACSESFKLQRTPEMLGCIAGADYELKNYKEASQIFDVLDNNAKGFLDQQTRSCSSLPAKCTGRPTSAPKRQAPTSGCWR